MTDDTADRILTKLDDIQRTLTAIAIAVQPNLTARDAYLRHHQRTTAQRGTTARHDYIHSLSDPPQSD